jgi:hypothetical protein
MRPWLSVTGTRCTRCTPPSNFSRAHGASSGPGVALGLDRNGRPCSRRGRTRSRRAPRPSSRALGVPRRYIRSRSPANSADSSPPSPALTSRIASRSSSGSRGSSSRRRRLCAGAEVASGPGAPRRRPGPPGEFGRRRGRRAPPPRLGMPRRGPSAAYLGRDRRSALWSACTSGSAICARARRARRRAAPPSEQCVRPRTWVSQWLRRRTHRRRNTNAGRSLAWCGGTGAGDGTLLGGLLAVARLEAGHAATGVEDLLLARVERVAGCSTRRRG